VLQRLAECAECFHALVDGVVAEHLSAKLQALFVKVARIHAFRSGVF
jgi:chloramphenicol O-acetyltransferase